MKILVIGHTYTLDINRHKFYELARNPGIELTVVTPKRWGTDFYVMDCEKSRNGSVRIIPLRCLFTGFESFYFYGFGLLRIIFKLKPDIIHVEQGADAFSYFQAIFFSKLFSRGSRRIFFTWVNWDAKIKFPLTFFENYNLKRSDYAICGNHDAARILKKKGFKGPIKVLPQLGVDLKFFKKIDADDLRKSLGIDGFCVGFLGRFVEEKGLLLLLEACSQIKGKINILLVGDGPLKRRLIEEANRLELSSKLIFVPPMMNEYVVPYINCMDVLVLPSFEVSTWKEQFGHVLIEAMACGVPVIGSSSGEIPNVIGDAGLIFKEKDAQDLRDKIEQVMNDRNLAGELTKKGMVRVIKKYTHRKIADETLSIYEELLCRMQDKKI
jgi:glycosyltransferase involved in cell wall biosynthesis